MEKLCLMIVFAVLLAGLTGNLYGQEKTAVLNDDIKLIDGESIKLLEEKQQAKIKDRFISRGGGGGKACLLFLAGRGDTGIGGVTKAIDPIYKKKLEELGYVVEDFSRKREQREKKEGKKSKKISWEILKKFNVVVLV